MPCQVEPMDQRGNRPLKSRASDGESEASMPWWDCGEWRGHALASRSVTTRDASASALSVHNALGRLMNRRSTNQHKKASGTVMEARDKEGVRLFTIPCGGQMAKSYARMYLWLISAMLARRRAVQLRRDVKQAVRTHQSPAWDTGIRHSDLRVWPHVIERARRCASDRRGAGTPL